MFEVHNDSLVTGISSFDLLLYVIVVFHRVYLSSFSGLKSRGGGVLSLEKGTN